LKTIQLLNTLNALQQQKLKLKLKENKREGLYKIYIYLQKWSFENPQKKFEQAEKERLFKKIFGYKYEVSKDYLLRNEIRLLNQEIKLYLDEQLLLQHAKENPFELEILYLKHLLKASQYKLFEVEWQRVSELAQQALRLDILAQLHRLFALFLVQGQEIEYNRYLKIRNLIADGIYYFEQHSKEELAEWERWYAFSDRSLLTLYSEHQMSDKEASKSTVLIDNEPIIKFLQLAAKSYTQKEDARLLLLQQSLELYEKNCTERPQYNAIAMNLYSNLAVENLLIRDYITADNIFKKVLPLLDSPEFNAAQKLNILFNYCSNALRLNRYIEVLAIYHGSINELNTLPRLLYRFRRIAAMAYIFIENPEKGFELMNEEQLSQRPEPDYYYGRIIFAILFFMTSDYESCERELINILQSFRYKSPAQSALEQVVRLMKKFLNSQYEPDKDKRKALFIELKQDIDEENSKNNDAGNIPMQWLQQKIELNV